MGRRGSGFETGVGAAGASGRYVVSYFDGARRVAAECPTADAALTCLRATEALTGFEASVACDGEPISLDVLTELADREAPGGPPPGLCWSG